MDVAVAFIINQRANIISIFRGAFVPHDSSTSVHSLVWKICGADNALSSREYLKTLLCIRISPIQLYNAFLQEKQFHLRLNPRENVITINTAYKAHNSKLPENLRLPCLPFLHHQLDFHITNFLLQPQFQRKM